MFVFFARIGIWRTSIVRSGRFTIVISGGRASARFVARKLGFLGKNELEEAKIDEILDGSQEFSAGKKL